MRVSKFRNFEIGSWRVIRCALIMGVGFTLNQHFDTQLNPALPIDFIADYVS